MQESSLVTELKQQGVERPQDAVACRAYSSDIFALPFLQNHRHVSESKLAL